MIDDQTTRALQRISLTPDGRTLHLYLQRRLMQICGSPGAAGALLLDEGERRFASELEAPMNGALSETSSDGPAGSTTDRPIARARTSGISIAGSGGARRRVPPGADTE
jgi:hypothetical protein